MTYVGIDTSVYRPDQLAGLKADPNNNAVWVSFYLDAPSHSNSGWPGHRSAVIGLGFNPVPIYVGQQTSGPGSHNVTASQGTIDGDDCAAKMGTEGFPHGSCCFLDLESPDPALIPYTVAWALAMEAKGWAAGVYVSHIMAPGVLAAHPSARIWAFKVSSVGGTTSATPFNSPEPSGSGVPQAMIWQHVDNTTVIGPGYNFVVDLDVATMKDPSAPLLDPEGNPQ